MHAQKIAARAVSCLHRAEVLVIILGQLAACVHPNLVQHPREIHHPSGHFFRAFWIGHHGCKLAAFSPSATNHWSLITSSDQPLIHHRVGDFKEASGVRAVYVISGGAVLLGGFAANLVNHAHDVVQPRVDFIARP